MKYYPYGTERTATGTLDAEPPATDKLFTGQQREPRWESALGLYNYGARFYSTLMGRFVAPDPLVQDLRDPQTLDAYGYTRNNPLVHTEPTGLCFTWMGTTFSCGADALEAWLDTALTSDSWIGDVARWDLQQEEFWNNFYTYGVYNDMGW